MDEAMLFGEWNEIGWLDRAEVRIFPPDQRFDLPKTSVPQRYFRLINHVEALGIERPLKTGDQLQFGLRTHITRVALSLPSKPSSSSNRTGFSTGPTMLRPNASPRRKADSSTRRSKPLTINT